MGCFALMLATSAGVSPKASAIGPSHSCMESAIRPRYDETPELVGSSDTSLETEMQRVNIN